MAMLESIQVGTPQRYALPVAEGGRARSWKTSFFRQPSRERRWLATTHLVGNAQADLKHHGTLDQALLLYAAMHYPVWRQELGRPEIGSGGFAENFTVDGLDETTACIGDVYAVGDAHIQVTGPRYPCVKISRRWGIPTPTARVAETGCTGWYCRVLQEGWVEPGMAVGLVNRPYPTITVARVNDFGHGRDHDLEAARELAACPLLPEWWQRLVVQQAMRRALSSRIGLGTRPKRSAQRP
jgi:MOSC domain-containing protein YiiM